MAMQVADLEAVLKLNDKDYKRSMQDAENLSKKTTGSIKNDIFSIENASKVAWAAVSAIAVKTLKDIAVESIKTASAMTELDNVINVTFGEDRFSAIALNADMMGKAMGRSNLQMRQMVSQFGALGKGAGFTSDKLEEMGMTLTKRAVDIGSFWNVADSEAQTALNSIYTGETETLKRFGVVMTEVNLKNFAMQQGITKLYKDMTEAERVQLRYNFVLSKTAFLQGDAERTIGSTANQMKVLKSNMTNLYASLGKQLDPEFNKFLRNLNNSIESLSENEELISNITGLIIGLGRALMFTGDVLKTSLDYFTKFVTLGYVDTFGESLTNIANGFEQFSGIFEKVGNWALGIEKPLETTATSIENITDGIKGSFKELINSSRQTKSEIGQDLFDTLSFYVKFTKGMSIEVKKQISVTAALGTARSILEKGGSYKEAGTAASKTYNMTFGTLGLDTGNQDTLLNDLRKSGDFKVFTDNEWVNDINNNKGTGTGGSSSTGTGGTTVTDLETNVVLEAGFEKAMQDYDNFEKRQQQKFEDNLKKKQDKENEAKEKEIKLQEEKNNKELENIKKTNEEAQRIQEENRKKIAKVGDAFSETSKIAGELATLFEDDLLGAMASLIGAGGNLATSLMSGNVLGSISSGLALVNQLDSFLNDSDMEEKQNEANTKFQEAVESFKKSVEDFTLGQKISFAQLTKPSDLMAGGVGGGGLNQGLLTAPFDIISGILGGGSVSWGSKNATVDTTAIKKALAGGGYSGIDVDAIFGKYAKRETYRDLSDWGKEKSYISGYDVTGAMAEINKLIAEAWQTNIDGFAEALSLSSQDFISNMVDVFKSGGSISESVTDMFKNGLIEAFFSQQAFEALNKNFSGAISEALLNELTTEGINLGIDFKGMSFEEMLAAYTEIYGASSEKLQEILERLGLAASSATEQLNQVSTKNLPTGLKVASAEFQSSNASYGQTYQTIYRIENNYSKDFSEMVATSQNQSRFNQTGNARRSY